MTAFKVLQAALAIMVLCMLAMPAYAMLTTPTGIFGYVKIDGSPASGAIVALSNGQSTTADSYGHYIFSSSVYNGSSYAITASYKGLSTSTTFTARGNQMEIDLDLSASTHIQSGGTSTYVDPPTITANPKLNEPYNNTSVDEHPVSEDNQTNVIGVVSGNTSAHETPAIGDGENGNGENGRHESLFQLIGGLVILAALSGLGYYLLLRER